MQMNLIDVVSLTRLAEVFKAQKLPMKTAFKMNKLMMAVNGHVQFFETKLNDLSQEYGVVDENGEFVRTENNEGIKIREDKAAECEREVIELYGLPIELPDDITFTLDDFENVEVDLAEMSLLSKFIKE